MKTQAFLFTFVSGVGVAVMLWIAVRTPRTWIKAIKCGLVTMGLLAIAAVGLPNFVHARTTSSKSACLANLKQVQQAKETWASEFKKADTDVPGASDLFGDKRPIRIEPTCPAGGSYRWGSVREKPTCSIGQDGHRWENLSKENSQPSSDTTIEWGFCSGLGVVLVTAVLGQILRMGRRTSSSGSEALRL